MQQSQLRKHYFLNQYVIITPGRAKRHFDIKERPVIEREESCPFCPENTDEKIVLERMGIGKKWQSLSLKNLYPAVTTDNKKAYGTQEVIIETPNHSLAPGEYGLKEVENMLAMYIKRTKAISQDKKIDYIMCFKNHGAKAGASKTHAHSQLFASAIVPPAVQEELLIAKLYETDHGSCAFCDIIKKEGKSKRLIWEDKNIVAIAPYASQFHYEAWIFPKRHLDNITLLKKDELKSLAIILQKIFSKLHQLDLSFNLFLHNVVSNKDQHLYIKIQPRDSIWAGVELGSGLVINSISPEVAAKFYKKP